MCDKKLADTLGERTPDAPSWFRHCFKLGQVAQKADSLAYQL
jgi:hypothetical protein